MEVYRWRCLCRVGYREGMKETRPPCTELPRLATIVLGFQFSRHLLIASRAVAARFQFVLSPHRIVGPGMITGIDELFYRLGILFLHSH